MANCVTKDLSRLGRNSAYTNLYANFTFPQLGVRYIAINDDFDSSDPNSVNNDFAGIKNWFNEFCARDTRRKIRAVTKAKGEREGAFFDCSKHLKNREKCTGHFIRESVLECLVLRHIQLVTDYILHHRQHFVSGMQHQLQLESEENLKASRKQLERNERRIAELKRLFIKIYENNAIGKLNDERFDMMSQSYEAEQKQLEAEVIALQQEIEVQERQIENIEKFIPKAEKYVGIEEINPYMLRELMKHE